MPEPIAPPEARRPAEAVELVSLAVSDGDLGAALAQYEGGASLRPWTRNGCAAGVREGILDVMELRLPLAIEISTILPGARPGPGAGRTADRRNRPRLRAGPAERVRMHRRAGAAGRDLADRRGRLVPTERGSRLSRAG